MKMQSYKSIRLLSILLTHALACRKSSTEICSSNPALRKDHLELLTVAQYLGLISFSLYSFYWTSEINKYEEGYVRQKHNIRKLYTAKCQYWQFYILSVSKTEEMSKWSDSISAFPSEDHSPTVIGDHSGFFFFYWKQGVT